MKSRLNEIISSHTLKYTVDSDGDGLSMVDMLTPEGDESVTRGIEEIDLLVDNILSEVGHSKLEEIIKMKMDIINQDISHYTKLGLDNEVIKSTLSSLQGELFGLQFVLDNLK